MVTMITNGFFLKKECSRLRIVECGDETPTAMRDTTHLRKSFGTIRSPRIKSRGVFPVDVPRRLR